MYIAPSVCQYSPDTVNGAFVEHLLYAVCKSGTAQGPFIEHLLYTGVVLVNMLELLMRSFL